MKQKNYFSFFLFFSNLFSIFAEKKILKKSISIVLAFLILYNSLGYFIVFKSIQYAIRNEIKTNIKNSIHEKDLFLIKLTNDEIKSGKSGFRKINESEFIFLGKLYDIIRIKKKSDTNYFYCINDAKEEQLYTALSSHVERQTDQSSPVSQKTSNLLKHVVKEAICKDKKTFEIYFTFFKYLPEQNIKLYCTDKEIEVPPPKYFLYYNI